MARARLVILIVVFALVAGLFTAFKLLPRRYWVADQVSGIALFWHEDEAFVFIQHQATARSTNGVLERAPKDSWWGTMASMYFDWRPLGHATTAWRVAGRTLERYELPNTVVSPAWELEDGRLVARGRLPMEKAEGFRWTGTGFARLPAVTAPPPPSAPRALQPDDEEDAEDPRQAGPVAAETRARLKQAGWRFKHLYGYEGIREPVAVAMPLRSQTCTLSLRNAKSNEFLFPYATTVELTGDDLQPPSRVLLDSGRWNEISRADFEARAASSPWPARPSTFPTSVFVLLLVWLAILIVKVRAGAGMVGVFGLKKKLVRAVGTTMTFPPAIPEQFPKLDRERLEATSRELEGLGFEKLLDTSPVTDAPTSPPTFCRIYAHRGHACYGVVMQAFPPLGRAIDLRCMLNGYLDDGWSVGYSNGKPMAASALVRTPRAIGVSVPGASAGELLAGFLPFRDRVCGDLGLRPIPDTSLEHYIRRTLENLEAIREAMKKKNVAVGLGQYVSRALASRTKPRDVWLGDYPKVAEERRSAGLGPGFSGTG